MEVTSCEEALPAEYRNGSRELTFNVLSGTMYDADLCGWYANISAA